RTPPPHHEVPQRARERETWRRRPAAEADGGQREHGREEPRHRDRLVGQAEQAGEEAPGPEARAAAPPRARPGSGRAARPAAARAARRAGRGRTPPPRLLPVPGAQTATAP